MVDDFSFNIYRTSYDICMEVCFFKEAIYHGGINIYNDGY